MLSIFANIRINSEERLQHMKDSFRSFKDLSDNWVVNVRGSQREEAIRFLKEHLGDRMTLFELLDDSRGWIYNAFEMLPAVRHEYMLLWNEDHICMVDPEKIENVASDMREHQIDCLPYTWWFFGKIRKGLEPLKLKSADHLDYATVTPESWKRVLDGGYPYGLISLCAIFKRSFFEKLLHLDKNKLPLSVSNNYYRVATVLNRIGIRFHQRDGFRALNRLLGYKLPRFSQETPFNLEKERGRLDILPLTLAWPKEELFACIDDELKVDGVPGYQLTKRGLYPIAKIPKPTRAFEHGTDQKIETNRDFRVETIHLPKGSAYNKVFYADGVRTSHILRQTVVILRGRATVQNRAGTSAISEGESISYDANIPHQITAETDVTALVVTPSTDDKNIKVTDMIRTHAESILKEIDAVLSGVDPEHTNALANAILAADKIVTVGAGRVGLSTKAFAMRLGHLGKEAYHLGDTTVPHIGSGSVLLACSGSGETQTIYNIVEIAKKNGATVGLITGNPDSRMGRIADVIVHLPAPSKTKAVEGFSSVQPMTTLNEQCLLILLDALVLQLMQTMNETHDTMWARHSNLE